MVKSANKMLNRKFTILMLLGVAVLFLYGCNSAANSAQENMPADAGHDSGNAMVATGNPSGSPAAMDSGNNANDNSNDNSNKDDKPFWFTAELKDVNSGNNFKISDFKGKPVFVETFAVWCPTCRRQQDNFKSLHEELGDSFVSVALDTDPNEDEAKVLDHTKRNGFTWRFVVSPSDVTQSLIDEFGIAVVSSPSAPVILVCPDQSTKYLSSGVKDSSALKKAMDGCGA